MSRPTSSKSTKTITTPIKDPRKVLESHYNIHDSLPLEIGEKIFSKPTVLKEQREVEEIETNVLQKLIADESVPAELKEKISKAVLSGNLEVISANEREFLNNYHNNDNLNNQSISKIDIIQQRERIIHATKAKKEAERARETFLYLKRHKLSKVPFIAIDSNAAEITAVSGKEIREQKIRQLKEKEACPVNVNIDPRLNMFNSDSQLMINNNIANNQIIADVNDSTSSVSFTNMIMDESIPNVPNANHILSKSRVDYANTSKNALARGQYADMLKAERRKKLMKNKEKSKQEREHGEHQRLIEKLTIEKKVELQKQLNSMRQKIREHLEAKKDPMRGEILRSLDESAILYLQQQYGNIGLSLSAEALLALIANHINVNYLTPDSILELSQHDIYISDDQNLNTMMMNDSSTYGGDEVFINTQVDSHGHNLLHKSLEKFQRAIAHKKSIQNINSMYSSFNNYPRANRSSSPHSLTAELSFNSLINNYNAFGQRFPCPQPGFAAVNKRQSNAQSEKFTNRLTADELLQRYEQGMKSPSKGNNNPFVVPNPASAHHYVSIHQNPFYSALNTKNSQARSMKAALSSSAPLFTSDMHDRDEEGRPFTYEAPLTLHEQKKNNKFQALGGGFRDTRLMQEQGHNGLVRGRSPPASRTQSPNRDDHVVNSMGMMVLSSENLHRVARELGYTEDSRAAENVSLQLSNSLHYTDEEDDEEEGAVKKTVEEERLAAEAIYSMHQQLQREGLLSSQKNTERVMSPNQLHSLGSKKLSWEDIFKQVRHQHPNQLKHSAGLGSNAHQYQPFTTVNVHAHTVNLDQDDMSQMSRQSSSVSITSNMNIHNVAISTPQPSSLIPNTNSAAAKAMTPSNQNSQVLVPTANDDTNSLINSQTSDEMHVITKNEAGDDEQLEVPVNAQQETTDVVHKPLFFGSLALKADEKQKLDDMTEMEQKRAAKRLILPTLQHFEKHRTDEAFTLQHLLEHAPTEINPADAHKIIVLDNDSSGITRTSSFVGEFKSFIAQQREQQDELHRSLLKSRGKDSIVQDAERRAIAIIESNKAPRSMKSQHFTNHIQRQTPLNMQYPRDLQSIPAVSPYPTYQESTNVMNYGVPSNAGLRLYLKRPKEEVTLEGRYRLSHAASSTRRSKGSTVNSNSGSSKPRPFISVT